MLYFDIVFRSCETGCKIRTYSIAAESYEAVEVEAENIADTYEADSNSWYAVIEQSQFEEGVI